MPTTIELPADVERLINALEPAMPADPEAMAMIREMGQLAVWPHVVESAETIVVSLLSGIDPNKVLSGLRGYLAACLLIGRIYGRLDKAAEDDGGDDNASTDDAADA